MKQEAEFYEARSNQSVQCTLCPHGCVIAHGKTGLCKARKNEHGTLYSLNYGEISALALDPIEKKPIHRYCPGTKIVSVGLFGCNMRCPFCQNHTISKHRPVTRTMSVDDLLRCAKQYRNQGNIGLAYTYNESVIGYEFVKACSAAIDQAGLSNVMVTNGFVNPKPLSTLLEHMHALNIDLKCFDPNIYRDVLGGDLETVKNSIEATVACGVHLEITMLIVPGISDDSTKFEKAVSYIASLNDAIPLHVTRYFPHDQYDFAPTKKETMERLITLARKNLKTVLAGNI